MPLQPGDPAPTVTAPNQRGEATSPPVDEPTVVYFYPEDGTPGCATEADEFQRELGTYRDAGVGVYGVSADSVDSHAEFADEQGVAFDLLSDPDGEVADAFDVERGAGGEFARTTFVLADGEVYDVYEGVDPDGHARTVLGDLLDDGLVDLAP